MSHSAAERAGRRWHHLKYLGDLRNVCSRQSCYTPLSLAQGRRSNACRGSYRCLGLAADSGEPCDST